MHSRSKRLLRLALESTSNNIDGDKSRNSDSYDVYNLQNINEPTTSNLHIYENNYNEDFGPGLSDSDSIEPFDGSSEEYIPDDSSSESERSNEVTEEAIVPKSLLKTDTVVHHYEKTEEINDQAVAPTLGKRKHFSPKPKTSRKRKINIEQWVKRKAAISREKGQKYKSYKGADIAAKSVAMGNLCPDKCRLKCSDKFAIEQRQNIMCSFYRLDINGKNALLFNSIRGTSPVRKKKGAIKHKTATYQYFLTFEKKQTLVCKRALMSLYQISKKKIEVIQQKIKGGSAAPSPDKRGHHSNRPHKIKDEVKDYVVKHISSFPSEFSHYSRTSNINKKYLSPLLSLGKMYELYLELCTNENKPEIFRIKLCSYRSIFVNEFNLSFSKPRSDTCSTCDAGKSNDEHTENYHTAFESMKIDRELAQSSDNVVYITIDLQQIMPLPRLTTSKAFYLRQLSFYNFGIHIEAKGVSKSIFCTWTENQGSKGSTDIFCSLLTAVETDEIFRSKDHLIIWSDSCGGQNKNFLLICLYQYLVHKNIFKVIDHKYPEVGHTYLDSDRDFGRIEKNLRNHEVLFTPEQYRHIITKSGRKNLVIDMSYHFRVTENLEKDMKLYNRKKDLLNGKVRFRDGIKWVRVENYGSYLYKECYDYYTPFKAVNIMKIRNVVPQLDNAVVIVRNPNRKNEVSEEKIEHLKQQLQFVPDEHQWFYRNIITEHGAAAENHP